MVAICPQLASRTVISSCTVCKKHFRTSQIFVEHLQSPEHRQRVEEVPCLYVPDFTTFTKLGNLSPVYEASLLAAVNQLQEKEGSEALGKLTGTDTDGFSLEELEDSETEEGQQDCTETQVL